MMIYISFIVNLYYKILFIAVLCGISLWAGAQPKAEKDLIFFVDPLVGTQASTTVSALKHGVGGEQMANTIPAVGVPFAMTQWTAETNPSENKCIPPYVYKDSTLTGFRATHWLSGSCTQDYGSVTLMPLMGKLRTKPADYAASFSHRSESAHPDDYRVDLPQSHLNVEMTTTARAAILAFTAHKTDSFYLLIRPNSDQGKGYVKVNQSGNEIVGYNPVYRLYQGAGQPAGISGYFVVELQGSTANMTSCAKGTFSGNQLRSDLSIRDQPDLGAYVGFKLQKGSKVIVRVGTSFTSIEEARKNLRAEIHGWNIETVRAGNRKLWEMALSRIRVQGKAINKRIFYTAMYHSMQMPRLYSDADGRYPLFSKQYQAGQLSKGTRETAYYGDFSMWDIYRAELPLYEILDPQLTGQLAQSLVLKGAEGGWMPIFPCWNSYTNEMIGDHAAVFIASVYLKGIKGFNAEKAYALLRQNAFNTPGQADYKDGKGRRALEDYIKLGYIPLENPVKEAFHRDEQVSRTLEYAYDDYALAMMAKAFNRQSDYHLLLKRSDNYKQVFDTSVGLVRGRYQDGSWYQSFSPDDKVFYITEGTPRQYSFYVPQDIPGLEQLMGGKRKFEHSLDSLFLNGQYWHGNEPGHQIPFLYNFTDAPWKTQQTVRRILQEEYGDGPGGLSGNDDAGQISAWYIFSALGFYPVDPVAGQYQICSPIFDQSSIHLQNGRIFKIITKKTDDTAMFIRSILLNGKPYKGLSIDYQTIMKGGSMEITLDTHH